MRTKDYIDLTTTSVCAHYGIIPVKSRASLRWFGLWRLGSQPPSPPQTDCAGARVVQIQKVGSKCMCIAQDDVQIQFQYCKWCIDCKSTYSCTYTWCALRTLLQVLELLLERGDVFREEHWRLQQTGQPVGPRDLVQDGRWRTPFRPGPSSSFSLAFVFEMILSQF